MGICFANDKTNDEFTTKSERESSGLICYALSYSDFKKMVSRGKCCTMYCPFFKPARSDIRLTNRIIRGEIKQANGDEKKQE